MKEEEEEVGCIVAVIILSTIVEKVPLSLTVSLSLSVMYTDQ